MQHQDTQLIGRQPGDNPGDGSARIFFGLVFMLSVPFWFAGGLFPFQLMPGLPVSALGAICPLLAAIILVHREGGNAAVIALLKRSFDFHQIKQKAWYAPVLLLMPAIYLVAYAFLQLAGEPLPALRVHAVEVPLLFLIFFAGGQAEELGWSGYAIDRLQTRRSSLRAALLLGAVTAVWHLVPLAQVGRSPGWVAWWSLSTVAGRVLYTWLYNHTGHSVFAAVVFHTMSNLSWQLFPNHGSHYDPRLRA